MIKDLKDIIICNNFYEQPDKIREYALQQEYNDYTGNDNWPGRDSHNQHVVPENIMAISHIVGEPLFMNEMNKSSYFRMTKEGQTGKQHIHFDPNPGLAWAGVCYLTPIEKLQGGTKFWRHNEYGWEKMPTLEEGLEHNIKTQSDMKNFFETDGLDESKWTETLNIPFSYNRLILFRPWLFHSNGINFGTTDDDARLVQLFFFHNDCR